VRQDSRFYPGIDARTGFRTRNILAVPLHNHAGEITGAFQVLNKQQGAFTAEDQEMLKAVAAQAAIAIETAQLIGGLQQQRDALLVGDHDEYDTMVPLWLSGGRGGTDGHEAIRRHINRRGTHLLISVD
jgi:GAF domain-containing protein